ncbi:predicted dehydrogenase [Chthonomonas calidirosea]|uniref:Predicted dehydrogenases and related proteins n=1 Tax=Chthonomonas calidirosea (strain DSM 23976 / ICMP 18418 / T49) TaxID=1303518 RepID=S0EXM7_CHTCT|nr:Gfo/Idh/MocA family oxidoreductase [Chthonomonas calidirosea]CCW36247.1 Predicted dehydrogenases and related proteins [Chthonomonas calidirosea T49]CEK17899.1 predicted dehydrogenase [Chthonomonas calidirosea]
MPKDKVRVGFIGCGGISRAHLPHLSKWDDVELVAFCDIVVERAKKRSEEYGGGNVYDDAATMLKKEQLDAAYILIPTYAHGAPERACIEAGVHFLVEKPLGLYPDDLRKLSKEVTASGLIASAGFMNRYRKSVNRVRELLKGDTGILLDGGWIGGPPLQREGDYFANNPIGLWWPVKEKSGGQMVEQVIHTVDLARYLMGEVVEVFAFAARGFNQKLPNLVSNYNLDDAMVMSLQFESGAVGNIMSCCATQQGGGVFLNIWASKHTAKFTEWAHHVQIYRHNEPGTEEIRGDIEDIFAKEDRAFIDAVKSGDASGILCPYADGVRSTLVALAGNESVETGKPVRVRYE